MPSMHADMFSAPETPTLGLIGLGYVGLAVAVAFGRRMPTIGFDVSETRVEALRAGRDLTREVTSEELAASPQLLLTADEQALDECDVFIVTVPTPVDEHKTPDLGPLRRASEIVGHHLSKGNVVIYESTVYPGATEEICVPILESVSGLGFNREFFVGYSPERVNPGDKNHRFTSIVKVTSGSTPGTADFVDSLYASVVTAGTHRTSSIQVAEAAKVIENTQRDVNIALVNELARLFNRLELDTQEVLEAAGTKWNFLPFRPGLVGGHCIGVDPYYLTYKAQAVGHHPEMILAGRRMNDGMGPYIADTLVKLMVKRGFAIRDSRILIMGLAFKENCPDLRNTRVIDIIRDLTDCQALVDVWDPWVVPEEAHSEYGIELLQAQPREDQYDAVVMAVPHREFLEMGAATIRTFLKAGGVLFDVKSVLAKDDSDARL